ncbi:MAG: hypothetical protein QM754_11765 [Tepidisphaeraceae bacterium]
MNAAPLDYAKPIRRKSAWREPEAFLSTLANLVLVSVAALAIRGLSDGMLGVVAALVLVAAALQLTTFAIAGLGVVEAIYCQFPSTSKRRLAWRTLWISGGNLVFFLAGVLAMVVLRG